MTNPKPRYHVPKELEEMFSQLNPSRNDESRHVTAGHLSWDEFDGRHDPEQRFAVYRLCACEECGGSGKHPYSYAVPAFKPPRCLSCRGEGRALQLVATVATAEAAGVALVELGREGEWEECPVGLLDRQGEKGKRWLIRPWLASPRNASDAGKLLRSRRK